MLINDYLTEAGSVCITGHTRPDGDCAGSALALYNYIRKNYPNIDVDVYLEMPTLKLSFLKGYDDINSNYDLDKEYDVMFCVDSASFDRIGKAERYFNTAKKTVNIDHHVSNPKFADDNYVMPDTSSCCEIIFGFLNPERIDRDIAICLYTGIVYDTGVFKYPSTTPKTMRIAASLMEYDLPISFIIDESFYAKSYEENRIFGYAIMKSKLACNNQVIYSWISKEERQEFGVSSRELEGIVAQLRLTKGVEVAICIHEINNNEYKVSFRSTNFVDVNAIAQKFGGGGHVRAAGATVTGELSSCISRILIETGKCFN